MKKFKNAFCLFLIFGLTQNLNAQSVSISDFIDQQTSNNSINQVEGGTTQFCEGNLLLNQPPNQTSGIFSDLDCQFCDASTANGLVQVLAENFSVAGTTTIKEIVLFGGYFPDNLPLTADIWTVNIHQDNGGLPGTIIYTETNVVNTRTDTGVDLFGVDEYRYNLTLATATTLSPGTYWIDIHNDSSENSDSVFWELGNAGTNSVTGSGFSFEYPVLTWSFDDTNNLALQICSEAYNLDVNVSGLAATNTVTITNGTDLLNVSANGSQTLSTLGDGAPYSVNITTQPDTPNQVCTVTSGNASGNMTTSGVTVDINCVTEQYDVNINVTGLAATNSVSFSNGADSLTISNNGTQTISTLLDESAYDVDITVQPDTPNQVCNFTNADSGNLAGADVTVNVNCVTTQYDVNINVTGLAATNSVSFSNGGDNLTFNVDGSQTISTLDDGSAFDVNITVQPDTPNQVCSFTNADSGNLAGGDATVNVSCVTTQYNVGVNVSGLAAGNSVILQNNGGDNLTVNNDGSSNFATALDDGSAYNVTVLTQPSTPNQTCVVSAPSGNLSGSDVVLAVTCTTNSYHVQISVVGLAATNSVSFTNGGDNLTISNNGTQTISTLLDESAYDVAITTQPVTPNQDCIFTVASAGTIAGADVTLAVECSTFNYFVGGNVSGLVNGNELALDLNNVQVDLVYCDGAFVFPAPILDGSSYSVTVLLNPSNPTQSCDVTSGSGIMSGDDVIDVNVSCAATVDTDFVFRGGFDCMPIF
ncbi:MAG: hypothetical protein R3E90_02640 [Marinicella sp.]